MTAYLVSISINVTFFMILALALNLQWGKTGMINFGIAGFYGIGAYTSGLLTVEAGWPWITGVLAAGAMAFFFGILVALLSVRLRDDFLAIVTLGFAEIVRLVLLNEDWLTRGPRGLPIDVRPMSDSFDRFTYGYFYLAMTATVVLVIYLIVEAMSRAPYGRVMKAIREDDLVAETLGKNVLYYRVQVFAIGAAFMGIAGALFAHYVQNISPEIFSPMIAIFIWMSVILGGAGNNKGLLIGAGVVMGILEGTRFLGDALPDVSAETLAAVRIILIGVLLILIIRFRPQGILPEVKFSYNPRTIP